MVCYGCTSQTDAVVFSMAYVSKHIGDSRKQMFALWPVPPVSLKRKLAVFCHDVHLLDCD